MIFKDIINEEYVFGIKIDKKRLNDEKYVRYLIKQINDSSKDDKKTMIDKIIGILTIISLLSIIGIPIAILLSFLSTQISKLKYDFNTKDIKKIDSYLAKCIKKLETAKNKSNDEKEIAKYEETIKRLEKNRKDIHDKINISPDRKRKLYGEKISDNEVKSLRRLIEKDLKPIVSNYNNEKQMLLRKEIDKYIDKYYSGDDSVNHLKDEFGKNYNIISGNKNIPINLEYINNNGNELSYNIINIGGSKDFYNYIFDPIIKEIITEFKKKSSISNLIINMKCSFGVLYIKYDISKVQDYLNSKVNESFKLKRNRGSNMKINELARIASLYGLDNSNSLRDSIIGEYTEVLESLDTIDNSIINKDINMIPIYKNNNDNIINEDVSAFYVFIGLLMFGSVAIDKINAIMKKIKTDKKYLYYISYKPIESMPKYGYENLKSCIANEAYYSLKIRKAEKNKLLYTDNAVLKTKVYVYKYNSKNKNLIFSGTFEDLCKDNNIELKLLDKSKLKDRDKIFKQVVNLVNSELAKHKELKSKADIGKKDEGYTDFINGVDDRVTILYCDVHDLVKNPRSNDDEDIKYLNNIGYLAIKDIVNEINPKLPKEYILKYDSGDWDDLFIDLVYTGSINENYNINRGEESYIVDLESLKYIVKTEQCSLQEAVQKIKDINYIGDTYDISVLLPENINESISIEKFIQLYDSLQEANIGLVSTKDLSNEEFVNEAFSFQDRANKWSEEKLRKKISSTEEMIKSLDKKLSDFKKLSVEEQRKFLFKQSVKTIAISTLAGLAVPVAGSAVYATYITMKGDNTVCTRKMYITNLNVLKGAYNVDLKVYKKALANKSKK